MALWTRVGTLTAPASGSSVITGLPGQPAAVLFLTASGLVTNTFVNNVDIGFGGMGRTNTTRTQRSVGMRSTHNVASSSAVRNFSETSGLRDGDTWNGGVVTTQANGFTVPFAATRPPTGTLIHWLAIGGDASIIGRITSAINIGPDWGTQTGVTYTGTLATGIIPVAMLFFGYFQENATTKPGIMFGVCDQALNQWSMAWTSRTARNPADTDRHLSATEAMLGIGDTGAKIFSAQVTSFANGNFKYRVNTAPGTDADGVVYALALGGSLFSKAGVISKPLGTAPAVFTIPSQFAPDGIILASNANTAAGAATENRGSIGFSDLTNNAAIAWSDGNAITPTKAEGVSSSTDALLKVNNSTRTINAAATATLAATGTDLTFSTNDAVATQIGYLILGGAAFTLDAIMTGGSGAALDTVRNPQYLSSTLTGGSDLPAMQLGAVAFLDAQIVGGSALAANLALRAALTAALTGGSGFSLGGLSLTRPLSGVFAGGSALELDKLRSLKYLDAVLTAGGAITLQGLQLTRPLSGVFTGGSDTFAYFKYLLPYVRPAGPGEMASAVNLHLNPGAEDGLANWLSAGNTTVTSALTPTWEGARSVQLTTAGSVAGQGLTIRSVAGTDLTGINPVTRVERIMWGSVYLLGTATNLEAWSRAVYTDDSVVEGERADVPALNPNAWLRAVAPPVTLNPAKQLRYLETLVTTKTASVGTWYADGAQIEEDQGEGITTWLSGAWGRQAGFWHSMANRSVSIREPIPLMMRAASRGGVITLRARMFRSTWDGQLLEDISDGFTECRVSMDPDRDVTWAIDANMTWEGYKALATSLDWIVPVMTITHPDGTIKEGRLGHYIVVPSTVTRNEYDATVKLTAYDVLWLLDRQGFPGDIGPIADVGMSRTQLVRQIMQTVTLSGGGQANLPSRYTLPSGGDTFLEKEEWSLDDSKLSVMNEILEGGGYYPLFTSANGIISSRLRTGELLTNREPVRTWAGNVPSNVSIDPRIPTGTSLPSEIVGAVRTTPKAQDLIDEIVLLNDNPKRPRIAVQAGWKKQYRTPVMTYQELQDAITNLIETDHEGFLELAQAKPESNNFYRILFGGRGRPQPIPIPGNPNAGTVLEIAKSLADWLSTRTQIVTVSVLPDPSVEYARETCLLGIWDSRGDPVAVGQFAIHNVSWGFTTSSCIQKMELGYVDAGGTQITTRVLA